MLEIGVCQLKSLNEEGYTDREIALFLGVHRTTVTRNRLLYGIPKANKENRKDKLVHCSKCKKVFAIRRRDKNSKGVYYCNKCLSEKQQNNKFK